MRLLLLISLAGPSASWAPPTQPLRPYGCVRAACGLSASRPPAFLTRELGKNAKLQGFLEKRSVVCEELPCIAFERLGGFDELQAALTTGGQGYVVLTSPEAATVFIDAWTAAEKPLLAPLATVGAGTAAVLTAAGLEPGFVPSKATGKTLAAELPTLPASDGGAVLYPASALAADVVESGLQARGFSTVRINTYTTVPADWSEEEHARATAASVVTFASPSAVRVWAERAGTGAAALCIGETSAKAARSAGFGDVRCPESPGVEAWADTVAEYYSDA